MLMDQTGLNRNQVQKSTGVTRAWMATMCNHGFRMPNKEWMTTIIQFLEDYREIQKRNRITR